MPFFKVGDATICRFSVTGSGRHSHTSMSAACASSANAAHPNKCKHCFTRIILVAFDHHPGAGHCQSQAPLCACDRSQGTQHARGHHVGGTDENCR